ncbi:MULTISPECIES: hypothetical protein [Herbaspirillum]|uniref:Uncharacterized protein n=2 Tax=Herbaspirillum huttiense TaxID=863372 RepID=A0AAJ2HAF0_9BURK|nr:MULTISPECIES: hypothetical protein [Herbaspirillum]MDR9836876.1 hypothetical protein [Herbaspirillum huttiense]
MKGARINRAIRELACEVDKRLAGLVLDSGLPHKKPNLADTQAGQEILAALSQVKHKQIFQMYHETVGLRVLTPRMVICCEQIKGKKRLWVPESTYITDPTFFHDGYEGFRSWVDERTASASTSRVIVFWFAPVVSTSGHDAIYVFAKHVEEGLEVSLALDLDKRAIVSVANSIPTAVEAHLTPVPFDPRFLKELMNAAAVDEEDPGLAELRSLMVRAGIEDAKLSNHLVKSMLIAGLTSRTARDVAHMYARSAGSFVSAEMESVLLAVVADAERRIASLRSDSARALASKQKELDRVMGARDHFKAKFESMSRDAANAPKVSSISVAAKSPADKAPVGATKLRQALDALF